MTISYCLLEVLLSFLNGLNHWFYLSTVNFDQFVDPAAGQLRHTCRLC